ncbi:MAG: alpha/beta hydrolase [Clostridiales bacterium]|nr:alpha/beta hydrolase [Clostridiales bacterium]
MGREDQIQTPIQKIFGRIFSSSDDITAQKIDELAKNMKSKPFQKFNIVSKRGEKLAGFYYEPEKYSHPNAIVIGSHGYHTNHFGDPATYIEYYLKNGYGVFTPDHIASGESEG